jgi:hypothetical protein
MGGLARLPRCYDRRSRLLRPSFWRSRRSAGCGADASDAQVKVDAAV